MLLCRPEVLFLWSCQSAARPTEQTLRPVSLVSAQPAFPKRLRLRIFALHFIALIFSLPCLIGLIKLNTLNSGRRYMNRAKPLMPPRVFRPLFCFYYKYQKSWLPKIFIIGRYILLLFLSVIARLENIATGLCSLRRFREKRTRRTRATRAQKQSW